MKDKMKYYKVLGKGGVPCNSGKDQWNLPKDGEPGKWMPKIDDIIPCERGYHLCRREDLIHWLNKEIYEAEGRGEFIRHDDNKDVFPEARLLRRIETWNDKTARLFEADCAEHVLYFFEKRYPNDDRPRKVIQAARDFANGKIPEDELRAAREPARGVIWDVGREMAREAARAATWEAAREAREMTWEAWETTWEAAEEAEKKWQTERLFYYLEGKP